MTPEEIMSFQGVEFTYVFEDGDTMPAYIKKIDLNRNIMSCWSFSLVTDQGYEFDPLNDEEKLEGACCLASPYTLKNIITILTLIKMNKLFKVKETFPKQVGFFSGCKL